MSVMNTSRMLESYCADIERLVREGTIHPAVRLSVALPDLCAALEDTHMQSSAERYVSWCAEWVSFEALGSRKPVNGERLHRLYTGRARMRRIPGPPDDHTRAALSRLRIARQARRQQPLGRSRIAQPVNRLQAFETDLIEALVNASRRWYQERGATNALVQRNLGRLLVTG